MKNTLLFTASIAALLAGIGLASAQGLNEHRDGPAAASSEQKAPVGEKGALPQKNEKMKPATGGQAQETVKPAPAAHAQETVKPVPTAQEKAKKTPTAQAPEKTESDRQKVGQSPPQGGSPVAAEKGSKAAAAPMSSEQNVKFRETLKGEKTERLSDVKFSISIGEEIPISVRFHRLPARIVEYAPQYRGFDYILVGDDILIVDPSTHRIVAVIAA